MYKILAYGFISGISFAIWPMFIGKIGFPGSASVMYFCMFCAAMISTVVMYESQTLVFQNINWSLLLITAFTGTVGLVLYGKALGAASQKGSDVDPSMVVITMLMSQIVVAAIFRIYGMYTVGNQIPPRNWYGFAALALGALLLRP